MLFERVTSSRLWLSVVILLLSSCTGTKFLQEGESYYDGAEIDFKSQGRVGRKKRLRMELEEHITPKPNTKILGSRPGVWFYHLAGDPEKKKGLRGFIRNKLGQPPVLLKDAAPDRTAKTLNGQLYNDGYFQSKVSAAVKTQKKESKIIYTVILYPPYRLRNIRYPQPRDSVYAKVLRTLREGSLLDSARRYDLERMQAEQERIEKEVENVGFYYFDDRYLIFEADSTVGKRQVDLRLRLEPGIPRRARRIYRLNQVNVYPNYILGQDTLAIKADTIKVSDFNYIDNKHSFRPRVITRVINLKPGEVYSREEQDLTLSHLMDLGVFRFVNIKFSEVNEDSALLNSYIYLTPLKKKSVRTEVQAVSKSNNFVGPGLQVTFTNRNFLRGAELFQLKLNSSYEVQISRNLSGPLNSFEVGAESSLTVPRFMTPIAINYNSKKYLPKTTFKAGFNLQNRVKYFRLNSFNIGYGYTWRETAARNHELFPIDINFVKTDKTSPQFDSLLEVNPFLAKSFENQFIIGSRYSYTVNTQLNEDPIRKFERRKVKTHSFYFNGGVDVAGNLLHVLQERIHQSSEGPFELFNSPYSQYVRGDVDFRYYWQPDENSKIATRINIGAGYAYGNSTTLPYIKQFSIGGSNSIRAFPARSIGPGTYNVRTDENKQKTALFIDQRGDIKLEGNIEYRFDIIKSFKGAMFVDAGNIWTWREDGQRPGAMFHRSTFLKELAVGTGVGLRIDFSFFVLRFDLAFPLRKPYLPDGERWVIDKIDFGSPSWRGDNLIFNIAIGYPF